MNNNVIIKLCQTCTKKNCKKQVLNINYKELNYIKCLNYEKTKIEKPKKRVCYSHFKKVV